MMPKDIRDDLDFLLAESGYLRGWCVECDLENDDVADNEWVAAAKRVAEWVKENCK
jgi:hypothetical protein